MVVNAADSDHYWVHKYTNNTYKIVYYTSATGSLYHGNYYGFNLDTLALSAVEWHIWNVSEIGNFDGLKIIEN